MSDSPSRTPSSASTATWGYRPHLDGLRAIAVYAVVLYHARIEFFSGGFVGVDLFFVLSGYLVTRVLLAEIDATQAIDLRRFYARRVRRLLPAASVLIVGTSVAALAVMPQLERAQFADDATASSLWFANWHFVTELNDYFAIDAAESPFVHFWSLAIEEQFYLAFPLALLLWLRTRRSWGALVGWLFTAFTASLTLQVVLAQRDINRAYLGTDTRVYQILAGSLLAVALFRRGEQMSTHRGARVVGGWGCLVTLALFVIVTLGWVDVTASTRGILAAAASVAAIGSIELSNGGLAAPLLSVRPVRYLGQISYGTYLWHWPVLVLARSLLDMSPWAAFALAGIVGTGLAALSSELVEMPIRKNAWLDRRPGRAILVGIGVAALTGLVVAPILLESDRRPVVRSHETPSAPVEEGAAPVPALDWEAIKKTQPDVPTCEADDASDCFIVEGENGTILLIGDSHSRMLIPPVSAVATELDMSLALSYAPSCPWQRWLVPGQPGDRFTQRCEVERERTYEEMIPALDPGVIILAGFPRSSPIGSSAYTLRDDWQGLALDELVDQATRSTVEHLVVEGIPTLIIEPFPVLEADPLSCLSAADNTSECVFRPRAEGIEEDVERRLDAEFDSVAALDLDGVSCPGRAACPPIIDGIVVRRDAHHLTPDFAIGLKDDIASALEPLMGR